MIDGDRPFRILGWHLKLAREQLSESVAEVSGAVEIDTETLEKIEQGKARPSEDVLLLLINHLNVGDNEANSLWELAGYLSTLSSDKDDKSLDMDLRIVYTDMANVVVNEYGVVMNFLQANGLGNQPLAAARVGMSKDQARQLLKLLQQGLDQHKPEQPKILPSKTRSTNKKSKKA